MPKGSFISFSDFYQKELKDGIHKNRIYGNLGMGTVGGFERRLVETWGAARGEMKRMPRRGLLTGTGLAGACIAHKSLEILGDAPSKSLAQHVQ